MAVHLQNVSVHYGRGKSRHTALDNASLCVMPGTIYGLLGPSGSGKTTVILTLLGMTDVHNGQVHVYGRKPGDPLIGVPGVSVGYMPQEKALHASFTGKEILNYYGRVYAIESKLLHERVLSLLQLLGLQKLQNRPISAWSDGQQRRVSLACALIHCPRLLLLDEPTVGVDPVLREAIWAHLEAISGKTTVIVTTHYLQEAERASTVCFMRKGHVLAEGGPSRLEQVYNAKSLEELFFLLCLSDETKPSVAEEATVIPSEGVLVDIEPAKKQSTRESLKALLYKDMASVRQHKVFLTFHALMPLVTFLLFLFSIGRPLEGLKLGLINADHTCCLGVNISCPTEVQLLYEDELPPQIEAVSCRMVDIFEQKSSFHLIDMVSLQEGIEEVKKGQLNGVVEIRDGFAASYWQNFKSWMAFDLKEHKDSAHLLHVYMDTTNQVVAQTVKTGLMQSALQFVKNLTSLCEIEFGSAGMVFNTGVDLAHITLGKAMMPGLMVVVLHFLALALTADQLVTEKESMILRRQLAAGLQLSHILLSQMVVHFLVIIPQVASSVVFLRLILGPRPIEVWFVTTLVFLLQAICGMCSGFLLTSLCKSRDQVIQAGVGVIFPGFVLTGILWPRESMPRALDIFSQILPFTKSCDSVQSILVNPSREWNVWPGILLPIIWAAAFFIMCLIITRRWHKDS